MNEQEKTTLYAQLLPQVAAVVDGEQDPLVRQAHIAALLHETFRFWWTGFYRVETDDTLVVGPYQGPIACSRIKRGRGVCGIAWAEGRTVVVPDVHQFSGHIACSSASRSEIVVPLRQTDGKVVAVLDIDSDRLAAFDHIDALWLEKIINYAL